MCPCLSFSPNFAPYWPLSSLHLWVGHLILGPGLVSWTIDTGSMPSVVDDWYMFPTYNKLFTERPSKIFEDLHCNWPLGVICFCHVLPLHLEGEEEKRCWVWILSIVSSLLLMSWHDGVGTGAWACPVTELQQSKEWVGNRLQSDLLIQIIR